MKLIAYLSLFTMFILVGFSACNAERKDPVAPQEKRMELDTLSQYRDQNYQIYTLEGCEYIVYGIGPQRWGSHKGDCKNPIHSKDTKELEDYIKKLQDENQKLGSALGYKEYSK